MLSHGRFLQIVWSFAAVLVVQAAWSLFVESVRPNMPYFPLDAVASSVAASNRTSASRAAFVGFLRGDLRSDYVSSFAAEVADQLRGTTTATPVVEIQNAAISAARLAPYDARVWLLLAAVNLRLQGADRTVAEPLKMSYYTGPSEAALIPLRITVSTRARIIENEELQSLATQDFQTILFRKPELKPHIVTAYRYASPSGKRFIEATLAKLDPVMLQEISRIR